MLHRWPFFPTVRYFRYVKSFFLYSSRSACDICSKTIRVGTRNLFMSNPAPKFLTITDCRCSGVSVPSSLGEPSAHQEGGSASKSTTFAVDSWLCCSSVALASAVLVSLEPWSSPVSGISINCVFKGLLVVFFFKRFDCDNVQRPLQWPSAPVCHMSEIGWMYRPCLEGKSRQGKHHEEQREEQQKIGRPIGATTWDKNIFK